MKTWHCEEGRMVSGTDIPYDVSEDGDRVWYDGSEVDAERAKDRKNYEDALTDMVKEKNDEIARLRNALEQIERGCSFPEDEVQKAIVKIAREALEGK